MTKDERKKEFFIGIDLGVKEKKTTGICILERQGKNIFPLEIWCGQCQDVFGKDVLKIIGKYLKETKVIAIDAPLTIGKGKELFRLYEKFLSTKIFRRERVNPVPPALMPKFSDFARELVKKLEKKGFVLGLNLIEVSPTLVKKISQDNLSKQLCPKPGLGQSCRNENQKSALICATLAFLHSDFKTRYLGYKDGFLFLPEMSFWKKAWRKKFYQAWMARPRLKYHRLITNIFSE